MQLSLQISFRNMDPSSAVEANIREKAEKFERFAGQMTSCKVTVEAPGKLPETGTGLSQSSLFGVPVSAAVILSRMGVDLKFQ